MGIDEFNAMQDSYISNQRIVESLNQMNVTSIEDILGKFEGWPLVLSAQTFSTTEFETLDQPKIHYMAIRALFMGKGLSPLRNRYKSFEVSKKILDRYSENWMTESPLPLLEADMFQ